MMAMYQLCRAKAAKHPFYIESIDINIYTIEELCFYLWKNVSLLDESILNEKLCDWLEGELGMQRLAFHLREKLKDAESIAELVLPVFREVRYLNAAEMYAVKEQIGKLEVQTEDIRRKIRADLLVNYGMYSGAVSLYRQILQNRNQGKTGLQFYAGVLSNMAGRTEGCSCSARPQTVCGSLMRWYAPMRCTAVIWQFCRCICRKKTIKSVSKS